MAPTPFGPLEALVRAAGRSSQSARRAAAQPITWALLTGLDKSLSALDNALSSSLAREALGRVLASPLVDDVVDRVLTQALESPEAERLVGRLVESRVTDAAVQQLLESDALWLLVAEIAQSPAVTSAISQQSVGLADQTAEVVRDHSLATDNRLERFARRLSRRAPRSAEPAPSEPALGP